MDDLEDIREAIPVIALLMGTLLAGMVHFGTGNDSSRVDHDIDSYNRIVKKRLEDLLSD